MKREDVKYAIDRCQREGLVRDEIRLEKFLERVSIIYWEAHVYDNDEARNQAFEESFYVK